MVNAQDFTYSKGYLGLLSALGASLGITFCCTPSVLTVYRSWRAKVSSTDVHGTEATAATAFQIPDIAERTSGLTHFYMPLAVLPDISLILC